MGRIWSLPLPVFCAAPLRASVLYAVKLFFFPPLFWNSLSHPIARASPFTHPPEQAGNELPKIMLGWVTTRTFSRNDNTLQKWKLLHLLYMGTVKKDPLLLHLELNRKKADISMLVYNTILLPAICFPFKCKFFYISKKYDNTIKTFARPLWLYRSLILLPF